MKRDEVREILPDISDEQLKKVMDLAGADINARKAAEQKLAELTQTLDKLKNDNATAADWQEKYNKLSEEIAEKEKQAQEQQERAVRLANVQERFKIALGGKKFSHSAIQQDYFNKFNAEIDKPENAGKSDVNILHTLTKDDSGAFKSPVEIIKLNGGTPTSGNVYKSKTDIMNIKDRTERRAAIAQNMALFNKNTESEE